MSAGSTVLGAHSCSKSRPGSGKNTPYKFENFGATRTRRGGLRGDYLVDEVQMRVTGFVSETPPEVSIFTSVN